MGAERRRAFGLRLRLTLLATGVVGIALIGGALILVGLLRERLDDAVSAAATLRAENIATLVESGSLPRSLSVLDADEEFVEIVDSHGRLVASSVTDDKDLTDHDPLIRKVAKKDGDVATLTTVPRGEDHRFRVAFLRVRAGKDDVTVYVGQSLEDAEATVGALTTMLAAGLPVIAAVVAAISWWSVGRTLRPVAAITQAMSAITAEDLHRRVPVPATRDEINRLAGAVNDTLARLDASIDQQRRFVADASHELRGPLASLRADLEISVTHPERTEWESVARDTLADVERLQHLAEDLLLLTRLDTAASARKEIVDLRDVVDDVLGSDRSGPPPVEARMPDAPVPVDGERSQLYRLVRNLVHNARQHATGHVEVSVTTSAGRAQLTVTDDGPGIPIEDRERIFERFVRLDSARTRDAGGTGLGLAIVHDVAQRHGGSVRVGDSAVGARLVVDLPLAGEPGPKAGRS